ncbi:hypothetical protein NLJ89_g1837 [Agrocybe chaxingu]|uniref:SET domain-containing protein n=1 Tax=Agrocybe chaxingu TaxID=84603 RepID=A0A9W8TEI4_9AGAR|nr:hypothetical protein NLJ89_g1837 [Agrocybe chaxingu]
MKRGFLKTKGKGLFDSDAPSAAQELPIRIGIPDRYDGGSKLEYQQNDSRKIDYDDNYLVYTTVPMGFTHKAEDTDGHSECIVHGPTKAKIVNTPGYPCAIPKPRRPNMCMVKTIADMGLGVFATCNIKVGELIFSERPLLVAPRAMVSQQNHQQASSNFTADQMKQITMYEFEKVLQCAAGRMGAERRAALMALANSHKEDGSGPILGIIRTNGFSIATELGDGPAPAPGQEYPPERSYSVVCDTGSRINHSCMPNVTTSFALASFSMQFVATREIKAGEQLFYSYCMVFQSAADRQEELAPYGFECRCPACVNATPERDRLRIEFQDKVLSLLRDGLWMRNPPDRDLLGWMLRYDREVVAEGLNSQRMYRFVASIIGNMLTRLGMHHQAKRYLELEHAWKEIMKDGS